MTDQPHRACMCHCDPDRAAIRLAEAMQQDHEAQREHDAEAELAMENDCRVDEYLEMLEREMDQ